MKYQILNTVYLTIPFSETPEVKWHDEMNDLLDYTFLEHPLWRHVETDHLTTQWEMKFESIKLIDRNFQQHIDALTTEVMKAIADE